MAARPTGERVFCHQCQHEWDRAHGGLTCPRCEGDFVEILEPGTTSSIDDALRPPPSPSPSPPRSRSSLDDLYNHNPWEHDDSDPDVPLPDPFQHRPNPNSFTTFEFTNNGGGGRISFSTRTIRGGTFGDNGRMMPNMPPFFTPPAGVFGGFNSSTFPDRNPHGQPQPGNLQDLFSMLLQSMQQPDNMRPQQPRGNFGDHNQPPHPFDLLGALFNPGGGRQGDMVFSQEAFDQVMSQLMEQNHGSNAPPPASQEAIQSLEKRKVDQEMLGAEGKAECSICMDEVTLGQEVTVLPCKHWFHGECVSAWLREHDTCPHCRKAISTHEPNAHAGGSNNRFSRRASSISSPQAPGPDGSRYNPINIPESPSDLRNARQRYYADSSREMQNERPGGPRHSSSGDSVRRSRRDSSQNNGASATPNNSGGGVGGWIRDHMPFS